MPWQPSLRSPPQDSVAKDCEDLVRRKRADLSREQAARRADRERMAQLSQQTQGLLEPVRFAEAVKHSRPAQTPRLVCGETAILEAQQVLHLVGELQVPGTLHLSNYRLAFVPFTAQQGESVYLHTAEFFIPVQTLARVQDAGHEQGLVIATCKFGNSFALSFKHSEVAASAVRCKLLRHLALLPVRMFLSLICCFVLVYAQVIFDHLITVPFTHMRARRHTSSRPLRILDAMHTGILC